MMTIDHLRVDHRITVLRDFTDANGTTMRVNDAGIIRDMSWDQLRMEVHIEIERDVTEPDSAGHDAARIRLTFAERVQSGPRNGRMREFFEMGAYQPLPGPERVPPAPPKREMRIPPSEYDQTGGSQWWRDARSTAGPDHLEEAEQVMRAEIDHIGVAASIAEMYAQRMRAFQAEGNEPRAIAAFKLADQWMATYAGWATSGGEGAALSLERDEFHDALVKEFGYDPTVAGT
ncbi:MAG: hypothetical protein H7Z40_19005 [Phycisphaerae bacterium]|nr:hypothetical protein [Gemmatimonadaceae bacterium]